MSTFIRFWKRGEYIPLYTPSLSAGKTTPFRLIGWGRCEVEEGGEPEHADIVSVFTVEEPDKQLDLRRREGCSPEGSCELVSNTQHEDIAFAFAFLLPRASQKQFQAHLHRISSLQRKSSFDECGTRDTHCPG